MFKIFVFVSVLIAVTSAAAGKSYKVSPFGIVEGIKDCGSNGQLGKVEVTNCDHVPCVFDPNSTYDISIQFRSSRTSTHLALHVFRAEDMARIMEVLINGQIEAGALYELKFVLPVTTEFSGMDFDIQFYVLDLENRYIELCAEAAVRIN